MKITFKGTYDEGKEIYCNKAKTRLVIAKSYDLFDIYLDGTKLRTCAYSDDAIEVVKKILELGIGRNYQEEK